MDEPITASPQTPAGPAKDSRPGRGIPLWVIAVGVLTPVAFRFPHINPVLDFVLPAASVFIGAFVAQSSKTFFDASHEGTVPETAEFPNMRGASRGSIVVGVVGLITWFFPLVGVPIAAVGLFVSRSCRVSRQRKLALVGHFLSLASLVAALLNAYYGGREQAMFGPDQLLVGLAAGRVEDFFTPSPFAAADAELQQHPTWIDPVTGLTWARKDNGAKVNWNQADNYCRNLNLAGYSDWRLPTIDELESIDDQPVHHDGSWHTKGGIRLTGAWGWAWSSSADSGSKEVWTYGFQGGGRLRITPGSGELALCVRGSRE